MSGRKKTATAAIFVLCLIQSVYAGDYTVAVYGSLDAQTLQSCYDSGVRVIFPSIRWFEPAPWAKAAVKRAHDSGLKVYPSVAAAYDGYGDSMHEFAERHPEYREKNRDGSTVSPYGNRIHLSWGYPQVRDYKAERIAAFIIDNNFDGVLLDYIRYFGNRTGYSDIIVKEFREKTGRDAFEIPYDDPQWVQFRADYVTLFIRQLRERLHLHNPELKIIACVGGDAGRALNTSLQDYVSWSEQGLIDKVVTMIYVRDTNRILESVRRTNEAIGGKVPHMPMIACWGDNLDTSEFFLEGTFKTLKQGNRGIAYYRSDAIRQLDMWPQIKTVAGWTTSDVDAQPVNYLLNSGFSSNFEFYALGHGNGVRISEDKVRTEGKSLELSLPENSGIRQLINTGLPTGKTAIAVGGHFETSELTSETKIHLNIHIVYKDFSEIFYTIPFTPSRKNGWQELAEEVFVGKSEQIEFIIFDIAVERGQGRIYIDDLTLAFTQNRVNAEKFRNPDAVGLPKTNDQNINFALGQLVEASSFWSNEYAPANAVNGNLSVENRGSGAAWHSQRPARDQWLKIYLPRKYLISKARMLNASAQYAYRTREYKIEISNDAENYTKIADGILPNDGETWTEIEFPPVSARYVKFTGITGYHVDYAVGLKEIEIY